MQPLNLRYERKYLLPNTKLEAVRRYISPYVQADLHADERKEHPEYTVRSIYFDNHKMDALHTKLEGLKSRKKLRIRGYNDLQDDAHVFLEIKRKTEDRISKNRARLPWKDCVQWLRDEAILNEDHLLTDQNASQARRFLFHLHSQHMQPVNLIVYEREPYHGVANQDIRITLDKNIRSRWNPGLENLFDNDDFVFIWKEHFILEIKYSHSDIPQWLRQLIVRFGLQNAALSKYVEGALCHPIARNIAI
jgi:hypothetical protein